MSDRLMDVYHRLYATYGPQHWWPGDGPFEVVAGAILTQSVAWVNVEISLAKMREADCWSFSAVHHIAEPELAKLVRSSGYFNAKARKLKAFAAHVTVKYKGRLDILFAQPTQLLREELLSIYGIGEETADDIIVYGAGKPSFVIDSYTRRIMDRLDMSPDAERPKYSDYQALFHKHIPADITLYSEFHALWDHHAKMVCFKTAPSCDACCLLDICLTGKKLILNG